MYFKTTLSQSAGIALLPPSLATGVNLAMSASDRQYQALGGSSAQKLPEGDDGTLERATRRDVLVVAVRNKIECEIKKKN